MTLMVMGEPFFLALTITASIGPSSVEATWPASAAVAPPAPCAAAGGLELERTRVNANAAPTKAMRRNSIAASLNPTLAWGRAAALPLRPERSWHKPRTALGSPQAGFQAIRFFSRPDAWLLKGECRSLTCFRLFPERALRVRRGGKNPPS